MAAATKVEIVLNDWDNEKSSVVFYFPPVADDGGNWDTLFTTPLLSSLALMQTVLDAITLCDHWYTVAHCVVKVDDHDTPLSEEAQREYVIDWTYSDNATGRNGHFRTPGPEPALRLLHSDEIDMEALAVVDFKTAIETYCLSPAGNPITLVKGKATGRRG